MPEATTGTSTGPWPPPARRSTRARGPKTSARAGRRAAATSQTSRRRNEEFANLITDGERLPRVELVDDGQVFAATMVLDYYAGLGAEFPFEEEARASWARPWCASEPVGVVGAIVPWNVPLFVTVLKIAPALVAGCTVVLKPSPETPLDAYLLAEIATEAGLPPGVSTSSPPAARPASTW